MSIFRFWTYGCGSKFKEPGLRSFMSLVAFAKVPILVHVFQPQPSGKYISKGMGGMGRKNCRLAIAWIYWTDGESGRSLAERDLVLVASGCFWLAAVSGKNHLPLSVASSKLLVACGCVFARIVLLVGCRVG